jgi:DNA-binding MarR family transcriptional regulator
MRKTEKEITLVELLRDARKARIDTSAIAALLYLVHSNRVTMSEFADAMKVSNGAMSGTVSHLVKKGYIERQTTRKDRRKVLVRLTDKGHLLAMRLLQKGGCNSQDRGHADQTIDLLLKARASVLRLNALMCLFFLKSKSGGANMTHIADELEVRTAAVTDRIDRLEKLGLVTRSPHPRDRRQTLVELTETAQNLLSEFQ